MGMGIDIRNRMAKRAAEEIHEGMIVNLGIGIPSLVPNHLSDESNVWFHAENGIVGMGASPPKGMEDENLCNAGGFPVTLIKGGSYYDSALAFAMIRRGRVDVTILGSLQVSQNGDLANWIVPGKKVPGMGGAMELAQKAKKVIVLMKHCDKNGKPKIVQTCSMPLTATASVDMIITDLAVFTFSENKLWLTEIFEPFGVMDVQNKTDAEFETRDSLRRIPY